MTNAAQQIQSQLGVDNALFQKQLKGSASWDELANGFEDNLRMQIANSSQLTAQTYALVRQEGCSNPEFETIAIGIMRDLKGYADQFGTLVSRRNGRTGPTKSPEDYTDYFTLGIELTTLSEEMRVVVSHAMMSLSEFHNEALNKIAAREAEAAAVDPNVVTDVTPKEVPSIDEAQQTQISE